MMRIRMHSGSFSVGDNLIHINSLSTHSILFLIQLFHLAPSNILTKFIARVTIILLFVKAKSTVGAVIFFQDLDNPFFHHNYPKSGSLVRWFYLKKL